MFPQPTYKFQGFSTKFYTRRELQPTKPPSLSFLCLKELRQVLLKLARDQVGSPVYSLARSKVNG